MSLVGIESMNIFAGVAYLDVEMLAQHRELDTTRFENLMMQEKSVALPYEDPITFGVNAAKPIIDALSPEEKDRIEMVITCTESSFDFSKSMATRPFSAVIVSTPTVSSWLVATMRWVLESSTTSASKVRLSDSLYATGARPSAPTRNSS